MPYLVVDDDFNRAWNKHNIGKVLSVAPSYTSVIEVKKIRFYFEYFPSGKHSNDICVQDAETFRSLRTWAHPDIKIRPDWLRRNLRSHWQAISKRLHPLGAVCERLTPCLSCLVG